jgi:hypothetical protein
MKKGVYYGLIVIFAISMIFNVWNYGWKPIRARIYTQGVNDMAVKIAETVVKDGRVTLTFGETKLTLVQEK